MEIMDKETVIKTLIEHRLIDTYDLDIASYCIEVNKDSIIIEGLMDLTKENLLETEKVLGASDFEVCFNSHLEYVFVVYKIQTPLEECLEKLVEENEDEIWIVRYRHESEIKVGIDGESKINPYNLGEKLEKKYDIIWDIQPGWYHEPWSGPEEFNFLNIIPINEE